MRTTGRRAERKLVHSETYSGMSAQPLEFLVREVAVSETPLSATDHRDRSLRLGGCSAALLSFYHFFLGSLNQYHAATAEKRATTLCGLCCMARYGEDMQSCVCAGCCEGEKGMGPASRVAFAKSRANNCPENGLVPLSSSHFTTN